MQPSLWMDMIPAKCAVYRWRRVEDLCWTSMILTSSASLTRRLGAWNAAFQSNSISCCSFRSENRIDLVTTNRGAQCDRQKKSIPTLKPCTFSPIFTISPADSWPRPCDAQMTELPILPCFQKCTSEPQMPIVKVRKKVSKIHVLR